uniref:Calmodulin n=1 Tax=Globodera pallida TaxID=36090 RepID=A0A183C8W9_GLOPA
MTTSPRIGQTTEDYRSAFSYFDVNKDGQITLQELENAMNKCGVHPTKLELRIIMSQMDKDKDGVVTFEEFVQMMRLQERELDMQQQKHAKTRPSNIERPEMRRELLKQFRMFDRDNDGYIYPEEMKRLVLELRLGNAFPIQVIDQLFSEADTDGDGKISFEEFVMAVI